MRRQAGIRNVVTCLLLLTGADVLGIEQQHSPCGGATRSRWEAGGSQYRRTGIFKGDNATPLEAIHGVSSTGNKVVVYDGAAPRVFVLDDALRRRMHFGRVGSGPGELVDRIIPAGRYVSANPILLTDSVIYLSDANGLKIYGRDGRFVRQDSNVRSRSRLSFDILGIHITQAGLVYAHERADHQSGVRVVDTWEIRSNERNLVHSFELSRHADRTDRTNSFSRGYREARPLWGAFQNCVFAGNGASPWLLRIDLPSGHIDSLRIPVHEVPPYRPHPGGKEMERSLRARGIPATPDRPPAALRRYAELRVDPDGHLWINPWREPEMGTSIVFRIDPQGRSHVERTPAFPIAFGPAGVFYSIEKDPDTDEVILVRYEKRK